MVAMAVVTMPMTRVLVLQLVLHRIRHRGARRGTKKRLELASFADLVAQRTSRAAAHDRGDEALFTVLLLLLLLLLRGPVGGWCSTAVLRLAGRHIAARIGVSGVGLRWIRRGHVLAVGGGCYMRG